MMFKLIYKLPLIILLTFFYLLAFSNTNQTMTESQKLSEWKAWLSKYPVPKGAKRIFPVSYFPTENQENQGIYFYKAYHLAYYLENKAIFVSDWGQHKIFQFDLNGNLIKTIGKKGQAPSEFEYPGELFVGDNGLLLILDEGNHRFQIFSYKGDFITSFKIYKPYFSYYLKKDNLLFANNTTLNNQEPLIEVLDLNGKFIKGIGERAHFPIDTPVNNNVYISQDKKGNLIAVFAYFDIVRKYDMNGKLLYEKLIADNLIRDVSRQNKKNIQFMDGKVSCLNVIRAVYSKNDNHYLLLTYPRLAILEFDSEFSLKNYYYWPDTPVSYYAFDFFIENDNTSTIKFYILQTFDKNRLEIFSSKEGGK